MIEPSSKSPSAFKTIGELAEELGLPQHILRYWETKFHQLKPLQRAGNRRYYRSDDVALAKRIDRLLNHEGYTVKGVQKLLGGKGMEVPAAVVQAAVVAPAGIVSGLIAIRDRLAKALAEDDVAARI